MTEFQGAPRDRSTLTPWLIGCGILIVVGIIGTGRILVIGYWILGISGSQLRILFKFVGDVLERIPNH